MKHPVSRLLIAAVLMLGILSIAPIWTIRSSNAQIIIPTFIFVTPFATPTRTPTPISIGNFVWDDLNKNGRQDAGEPGLEGIQIQLWNGSKTQLLSSTTSAANGTYHLIAPQPGTYRIRALLPFGAVFSPKDAVSGNDLLDSDINPSGPDLGFSDVITIPSNLISTTLWDIGIIPYRPPTPTRTPTPIFIGNFVWHDLNQNGLQDAGEPGIGNVHVQLWNDSKTQLIYTNYSAPNGSYEVIAPQPGNYRIRVILPAGASISPKDVGTNDLVDSDINPSGPDLGFSDTIVLPSNLISTTTWDIGLMNIVNTPTVAATNTPTLTNTPTVTHTATATNTPTATATTPAGTPAVLNNKQFLPFVRR